MGIISRGFGAIKIQKSRVAKKSPSHANHPALVSLGKTIRERRKETGLSQEALAFEAGIDRSYIGGIERGEHNLALVNLMKIAAALKLTVSQLCERAGI